VLIGAPNVDPGNNAVLTAMHEVAQSPEVTFYGNTARAYFVNLMRHATLMVGNSSAGLLEAASVRLPVINLGERQRGRLCGRNVVFSNGDTQSFRAALDCVESEEFRLVMRTLANPYGDGHSEARAVELLKQINFGALLKKSEDPLHVHP